MCCIRSSITKRFIFKGKVPGNRCLKCQIQINAPHSSGFVLCIQATQYCRFFSGDSICIGSIGEIGINIIDFFIRSLSLPITFYPKKAEPHRRTLTEYNFITGRQSRRYFILFSFCGKFNRFAINISIVNFRI